MVSKADLEEFRRANTALATLVGRELESLFGSLNLSRPEAARDLLLEVTPGLTERYGQAAAGLAAEWYDEQRAASGAAGRFRSTMAPSVAVEAVQAQVRYHAGHLWSPEPLAMLTPLLTSVDKFVKQPGRDTMALNADREGVRWARVPSGRRTCAFCLMIASRDAVFISKRSAGGDGNKYHGFCDCQPVRIGPKDEYPEGYLPDNYYEMYSTARDEAGSGNLTDITAAFRRTFPAAVTDGIPTP